MARGSHFDLSTIELYDQQIVPIAQKIFDVRKSFSQELTPIFYKYYQKITGKKREEVSIIYKSQLLDHDLSDSLKKI